MIIKSKALLIAFIFVFAMFLNNAWAGTQFLSDGAKQDQYGGWDLPTQGTCPADLTRTTRPDCLALRLNFTAVTCPSTNLRTWTTSGVCNDRAPGVVDQTSCESKGDRLWNASTNTCAIIMKGDDRNNVTCAIHQGSWETTGACIGVWVFPDSSTYTPPLLTGTTNPGPGDQCLRCHNFDTQYNGPRVRDVENVFYTGHKNMARKSTIGLPWGGPPFTCTNPIYKDEQTCEDNGGDWRPTIYPSDDAGNPFNWTTGQVTISGTPRDIAWIYGDWLSPLPREIAKLPKSTSYICSDPRPGICSNAAYVTQASCEGAGAIWTSNSTQTGCQANGFQWILNAGASYSCARCHTTGWTSDSTVNTTKEPEKSFPGIVWSRTADALDYQVNTAGGVAGDSNKSSSWDQFGIICTRCHTSAVDNTTNGGVPPFSAAAGMSSHHSNITAPDVSTSGDKGYCSDSRFTARTQCDDAGAAWLTQCTIAGVCSNPAYTTSGTCKAALATWTPYVDSGTCTTNGGVWQATPSCTVAGICNDLDPTHNTQTLCQNAGKQWAAATDIIRCLDIHEYGKEHDVAVYEAARWTGSKTNRGQIITSLCMNCHRQETSGLPYLEASASAGTYDNTNPGMYLKVGPAHGNVAPVSHPHGNMFLNSPHGQFTGTFNQIPLSKFGNGYGSDFQNWGEAANTGNGCTGCHDPHESVVPETSPSPAIREECTECHSNANRPSIPQVNLATINHLGGTGTPLEDVSTNPSSACESCHMPEGLHLWRINPSASYSTYPSTALTATVNANTSPDGSFTNAVWVDVDAACGQCHGGGTAQATTNGTTTALSKVLTVDSTTGFVAGERIKIQDAGALTYDEPPTTVPGDFETYIVSVVPPSTINLAGAPTYSVSSKPVTQNATKNNAPYYTKSALAEVALGMHASSGITYPVTFTYTIGNPNTLLVNVDAIVDCGSDPCPTFTYDWDWGDGTAHGTLDPDSHTYANEGTKTIILTVLLDGKDAGSSTRSLTLTNPDLAPTSGSTCTWNGDTWVMQVVDSSSDDGPDPDMVPPDGNATLQISVTWGDGKANSTGSQGGTFTHTYTKTGTFTVTPKATDSKQQVNSLACPTPATPAYFTISGTVKNKLGTAPIASAVVNIKKGTTTVKTVYTDVNGNFSAGSLGPATYNLTVIKAGYTFANPAATKVLGPSGSVGIIYATGP